MESEIPEKTATELKAEAFDLIVQIQNHQLAIQQLQQQLEVKNQEIVKAS